MSEEPESRFAINAVVELVPIEQVQPAKYNPRIDLRPGDPVYEDLRRSLDDYGLVEPLIWNRRNGVLIGGHQRLKLLKERGDTEVPVIPVELDDAHEKALNLALNKIKGRWDFPRLLGMLSSAEIGFSGFSSQEISDLIWRNADSPMRFPLSHDDLPVVRRALRQARQLSPDADTPAKALLLVAKWWHKQQGQPA